MHRGSIATSAKPVLADGFGLNSRSLSTREFLDGSPVSPGQRILRAFRPAAEKDHEPKPKPVVHGNPFRFHRVDVQMVSDNFYVDKVQADRRRAREGVALDVSEQMDATVGGECGSSARERTLNEEGHGVEGAATRQRDF